MTEIAHGDLSPAGEGEALLPRWWRTLDHGSLVATMLLVALGLLLAFAASVPLAERNDLPPFHFVERQIVFAVVAVGVVIALSMLSPKGVRRFGTILFAAAFLSLVLLPFLGTDYGKGAVRWYSLGFASLQPSEFVKPGLMVVSGWMIAAAIDPHAPPGRLISFFLMMLVVGLLVIQPDFGQSALVVISWAVVYFVGGGSLALLIGIGLAGSIGMAVAYNLSEHFARRIDGFLTSEVDPNTQLAYALDAIREGGLFGVGVGEGTVKQWLPDAHTDFVIAVAAEEYGLVLVLLVIALYLVIILRSLARLMRERDPFIRNAGVGLVALLGFQAFVNMGVAVRLLPAKGMTLPFISYGGSSLLASAIVVGLLLALTRSRPQGELEVWLRRPLHATPAGGGGISPAALVGRRSP